jgi:hypothetical protein
VWQVDSLTYFDTADGAKLAAIPEPASFGIVSVATMLATLRRRRR